MTIFGEGDTPPLFRLTMLRSTVKAWRIFIQKSSSRATVSAARPVTAGFGLGFSNIDGSRILTLESDYNGRFHEIPRAGEYNIILRLPILDLIPGCYHVDIGAFGAQHEGYHYHPKYTLVEVEPGPNTPPHLHGANGDWRPASDWQLMPA